MQQNAVWFLQETSEVSSERNLSNAVSSATLFPKKHFLKQFYWETKECEGIGKLLRAFWYKMQLN